MMRGRFVSPDSCFLTRGPCLHFPAEHALTIRAAARKIADSTVFGPMARASSSDDESGR